MIGWLKGTLLNCQTHEMILNVGGVGYRVEINERVAQALLNQQGETISIWVHTHVREGEIRLFGFLTELEQGLFEKLITVSGVGPKLANAILAGIAPHDLMQAIALQDISRLSSISGIGKKTAERICLDLKDKITSFPHDEKISRKLVALAANINLEAVSALTNLGYTRTLAEKALSLIPPEKTKNLAEAIKSSLALLGHL